MRTFNLQSSIFNLLLGLLVVWGPWSLQAQRFPIRNGELQSDLNAARFALTNVAFITDTNGNVIGRYTFVNTNLAAGVMITNGNTVFVGTNAPTVPDNLVTNEQPLVTFGVITNGTRWLNLPDGEIGGVWNFLDSAEGDNLDFNSGAFATSLTLGGVGVATTSDVAGHVATNHTGDVAIDGNLKATTLTGTPGAVLAITGPTNRAVTVTGGPGDAQAGAHVVVTGGASIGSVAAGGDVILTPGAGSTAGRVVANGATIVVGDAAFQAGLTATNPTLHNPNFTGTAVAVVDSGDVIVTNSTDSSYTKITSTGIGGKGTSGSLKNNAITWDNSGYMRINNSVYFGGQVEPSASLNSFRKIGSTSVRWYGGYFGELDALWSLTVGTNGITNSGILFSTNGATLGGNVTWSDPTYSFTWTTAGSFSPTFNTYNLNRANSTFNFGNGSTINMGAGAGGSISTGKTNVLFGAVQTSGSGTFTNGINVPNASAVNDFGGSDLTNVFMRGVSIKSSGAGSATSTLSTDGAGGLLLNASSGGYVVSYGLFRPSANATRDLGLDTHYWRNLFAVSATIGTNGITNAGAAISTNGVILPKATSAPSGMVTGAHLWSEGTNVMAVMDDGTTRKTNSLASQTLVSTKMDQTNGLGVGAFNFTNAIVTYGAKPTNWNATINGSYPYLVIGTNVNHGGPGADILFPAGSGLRWFGSGGIYMFSDHSAAGDELVIHGSPDIALVPVGGQNGFPGHVQMGAGGPGHDWFYLNHDNETGNTNTSGTYSKALGFAAYSSGGSRIHVPGMQGFSYSTNKATDAIYYEGELRFFSGIPFWYGQYNQDVAPAAPGKEMFRAGPYGLKITSTNGASGIDLSEADGAPTFSFNTNQWRIWAHRANNWFFIDSPANGKSVMWVQGSGVMTLGNSGLPIYMAGPVQLTEGASGDGSGLTGIIKDNNGAGTNTTLLNPKFTGTASFSNTAIVTNGVNYPTWTWNLTTATNGMGDGDFKHVNSNGWPVQVWISNAHPNVIIKNLW